MSFLQSKHNFKPAHSTCHYLKCKKYEKFNFKLYRGTEIPRKII